MKLKVSAEGALLASAALRQQLHAEASFLQHHNLSHQSACSELSFQLTQTNTRLEVRTAELARLRRQGAVDAKVLDLRRHAGKLEKENERLRERAKSLGEGFRLQGEIAQARELQRLYQEKLRDLRERLPVEESQEDAEDKLKQVQGELLIASKERDYLRDTVLQVLKQTVDLFEQHKANLLSEIAELQGKPPLSPLSPLGAAVRALGLSPRMGKAEQLKTSWSSSKTTKASSYTPSFFRTRRPVLKVKYHREIPTAHTIVQIDEFADAFPEEDELSPID
jgi:hypothetical protein